MLARICGASIYPRRLFSDVAVATKFAVIQLGGHQFKVCEGDSIMPPKLKLYEVGQTLKIKPLLVGSVKDTLIGRPYVDNMMVQGIIQEHVKTEKIIVFKKKRRHGYRRTKGFKASMSIFKITSIYEVSPESITFEAMPFSKEKAAIESAKENKINQETNNEKASEVKISEQKL